MTSEPERLRLGYSVFVAFIRTVSYGIWVMLGAESLGETMFGFARLLLFIAFGYAIVACYGSSIGAITCGT
jgi:hypothetical protein